MYVVLPLVPASAYSLTFLEEVPRYVAMATQKRVEFPDDLPWGRSFLTVRYYFYWWSPGTRLCGCIGGSAGSRVADSRPKVLTLTNRNGSINTALGFPLEKKQEAGATTIEHERSS